MEHNPELLFWHAVDLVNAEKVDDALPLFKQVFDNDPRWLKLVPRLVPAEQLPNDLDIIEQILKAV